MCVHDQEKKQREEENVLALLYLVPQTCAVLYNDEGSLHENELQLHRPRGGQMFVSGRLEIHTSPIQLSHMGKMDVGMPSINFSARRPHCVQATQ